MKVSWDSTDGLRVAIAGATGLVGRELIAIAEREEDLPLDAGGLGLFASAGSAGQKLPFRDGEVEIADLAKADFKRFDAVLFCVGDELSAQYVPQAVAAGCRVVDKSNAFRMKPDVPLVVAGVNDAAISPADLLVANPNCSTIILAHALKPLQDAFGISSVFASTYQSVSGAGRSGAESLLHGIRESLPRLSGDLLERPVLGSGGFAHNVIPAIGRIDAAGQCSEEAKLVKETRKILGLPELPLTAHAVRVPVLVGHSIAVTVELGWAATADNLIHAWEGASDVRWLEGGVPTPVSAMHHPQVEIGRLRAEPHLRNGWSFFISGDNLTLGAALNGWRILRLLAARDYSAPPAQPVGERA
jgi:aspartate-semialdehyde dehydrogenase